jgi:predicted Zn finger-like uncharacterized protein
MRVECTTCKTKYVIADEKVPAGGARIRCRKCQSVFTVSPPAPPVIEPAPTDLEMVPAAPSSPEQSRPPLAQSLEPPAPPASSTPALKVERGAGAVPEPEAPPRAAPAPVTREEFPAMAGIERSAYPGLADAPAAAPPSIAAAPPARETTAPVSAAAPPVDAAPAPPPPAVIPEARVPSPAPAPPRPSAPSHSGIPAGLSDADRAKHERARRLARVLASDIAIYNKEKRDRGVQEGNLVAVLGYEIKKSWEIYKERVTPEMANSTPYFRDALNEIVAEGKKVF